MLVRIMRFDAHHVIKALSAGKCGIFSNNGKVGIL
jgi:hypothetical protein